MRRPDDLEAARGTILLEALPGDMAEALIARARTVTRARGETIFFQGERARQIFIVVEGWVKLYRSAPNGSEAVIAVFTRGHSFGEALAFRAATYPVTAEAVTDCRLLGIDAELLLGMMRERPELVTAVLAAAFVHLHALVGQLEQLTARTGAQRLGEFLLQLCTTEAGPCTIMLPYDKGLIAGRLGMQPESLSRAFQRLHEVGVRVRQNHAAIAAVERLQEFVDRDRAELWRSAR